VGQKFEQVKARHFNGKSVQVDARIDLGLAAQHFLAGAPVKTG
jgi:hypothetical protein